jgi:hypothetical protein
MPLEPHRKKIGEHDYIVNELARKPYVRLLSIVTKALTGSGIFQGRANAGALIEAAAKLGPEDIDVISEILGEASKVVTADGKGHTLTLGFQDLHFMGRYSEYFQWLAFGIEVNLRPLLTGLVTAIGGGEQAAQE